MLPAQVIPHPSINPDFSGTLKPARHFCCIAIIRARFPVNFYLATSFIFPRSLRMRLFALCFVSTHVPLLAYCGWGFASGRITLSEFLLLTLATVVGMVLALVGIGALLSPIQVLAEALHRDATPAPLVPEVGDIIHTLYAGVQRSAAHARARIDELDSAAHEDPLTGIPNRRGFLAQLETMPEEQRRGCVAIVDIDHFKSVNDRLGHDEGDRVLCAFAARLAGQLRRADLVARWGGEEFAIFFDSCSEEEACTALERIAAQMRSHPIGNVEGRIISFSAGLCGWTSGNLDDHFQRADEALYAAKQGGRDRVCRALASGQKALPSG
jgi:diguanylate cyclase (GGDEF)-like protein